MISPSVSTIPATENKAVPLLSAHGIVKRFGERTVNDVDLFEVRAGEVHALLGENGAGKSTLTKILYGYYRPDAGEIRVNGVPVEVHTPAQARALGIGMVFQDFTLISAFSVLENIALFMMELPLLLSRKSMHQKVAAIAAEFRLMVDLQAPVSALSIGDRQKVEILKLILAGSRVLVLDEPTKVLVPQERAGLFDTVRGLRDKGFGVVFITHKLGEVMEMADRVSVMREGRIAGVFGREGLQEAQLLKLMFADRADAQSKTGRSRNYGEVVLRLNGISTQAEGHAVALQDISLNVRAGEILGIAGVSGSGQAELGAVVLGKASGHAGEKHLNGQLANKWSIAEVRSAGVGFVPENPLEQACVGWLTVAENFALGDKTYRDRWTTAWARVRLDLVAAFAHLNFPAPRIDASVQSLSGGNVQRVVIARELAKQPKLIVAFYPTRGLDVHSAEAVRARLQDSAQKGAAIVLVSEDMDELFAVSDRVAVLFQGKRVAEFEPHEFDPNRLGAAMVGAQHNHYDY